MKRRDWHRRNHIDWLKMNPLLSLEERGALSAIVDLIHYHANKLKDGAWIGRAIGADPRVWNRLRSRLIELGKIVVVDGVLTAPEFTFDPGRKDRVIARQQLPDSYAPKKKSITKHINDLDQKKFEEFWEIYPRKVGKPAAMKAFARAPADAAISTAASFALACRGKDPQYIPHPATWLNRRGWEDDISHVVPPNGGGNGHSPWSGQRSGGGTC